MGKSSKFHLSEKQVGYLLIFPALLLIIAIAIWPVLYSFWLSLHDIRLNDPTKTEIHSNYGLDMERFVQTYPILNRVVTKETQEAKDPAVKSQLESIGGRVKEIKGFLSTDPAFAQRYEQVDELLFEFKPVTADLKFLDMNTEMTEKVNQVLAGLETEVQDLGAQKALAKPDDLLGLVRGVKQSIIEPNYIGFSYYSSFLQDKRMWASLWNTLVFTVLSVAAELVLGLLIALLINKEFRGRGLIRASILIPWAIPTVISALMWRFLYDGQNGIVAYLFETFGFIADRALLLTTKEGAMFSVIFSDVWKTAPFMALLLFAGLQTIPQSLYEAASVDGATKIQQFFRITLPLLKSTIMVALVFRTLEAFRVFDLVYALTGGGPANSTETISILAYKTMFAQMNFGAGSALAVIVFLCVALISIGYIKLLGADLIGDNK
ncbi:carbohydrate ABC transporter permease [Brevibacillus dissolubilis]|uniref:carbohydrate ABC transporter permease n=1 Tax=Brevibacillus dissolubilis TaxID=1844116 RepID=UPI0011179DED|nr:sugar ABC transporter permease [Brevibacillus dissolubilis]